VITLVGDFNESEAILNKYFSDMKDGKVSVKQAKAVKLINTHKVKKVKRRITNSYMVFGYETVPRSHEDSYILDIIQALLGKGQSGRLFNEIRNKRGLAYEVGVHNECSKETGFFTVYLSTDKKNIKLITNLILEEFQKLKSIDDNELNDAKGFVEGRYLLDNEDTHNKADVLGFWELIEDGELEKEYINNIQKVSKEDIKRIVDKYLTKDYTLTVVEQEDKKKK
jgi:predicted Zn-dependent peptidase